MAMYICQGCGDEFPEWKGRCINCGNRESIQLSPKTDKMIDKVIKGKFKILKKLGQGGMGAVYLAEQVGIGHQVALKFLKAEFSNDTEIARRFLNEAKSYARVAHPNAVALHDFGQDDDGNLFIAMEYCEGVDLKRTIAEGRLSLFEASEIILQVADVLANAHEKGVIHRDLKPENIMIRRGLRGVHAKVLDFGIARLMNAGTRLTQVGAIAGTPRYMSPEQVHGQEVDNRADIYALGVLLFECLTGKQPFDGHTIAEILRKQALDPMPLLSDVIPELDHPQMDVVIQKACAKRREERYADMVEFAQALSLAIPTQAGLGMTPLELTNKHRAIVRIPTGSTGKPREVLGETRTALEHAAPAASKAARDRATPVSLEAKTQVDLKPRDESKAPRIQRSRAPLIALGFLGTLAILGIGYGVWASNTTPPAIRKIDVLPVPVVPIHVDAVPVEVKPEQVENSTLEAVRLLRETNARGSFTAGRTSFENADLDAAETNLKSVEAGTTFRAEADALLQKIELIRKRLAEGQRLKSNGQCDAAIGVFQEALKLNSRLKEAQAGIGFCKSAQVEIQMP
jgi:eukaryotic-like serine/threonine-protein kinase